MAGYGCIPAPPHHGRAAAVAAGSQGALFPQHNKQINATLPVYLGYFHASA